MIPAVATCLGLATGAAAIEGGIEDDVITVTDAFKRFLEYREHLAHPNPLVRYEHYTLCNVDDQHLEPGVDGCPPPNGTVAVPGCGDDDPIEPLWKQTRSSAEAPWGPWDMIIGWICPDELLPPFTEADFRRLTIEPSPAHRQPASGTTLVNKPLIVYTERTEREFRTTLYGFAIDVVARPVEYVWDFGDGTTLNTTSVGAPYPSFELTHTYAQAQSATVALTTIWSGTYRVDEDPDGEWRAIRGTGETTTTLAPFDVVELRSHLVDP